MTLTRTIRRREKRQRAKARQREYHSRRAAMTPKQRAAEDDLLTMLAEMALPLLRKNLASLGLVTREYK